MVDAIPDHWVYSALKFSSTCWNTCHCWNGVFIPLCVVPLHVSIQSVILMISSSHCNIPDKITVIHWHHVLSLQHTLVHNISVYHKYLKISPKHQVSHFVVLWPVVHCVCSLELVFINKVQCKCFVLLIFPFGDSNNLHSLSILLIYFHCMDKR